MNSEKSTNDTTKTSTKTLNNVSEHTNDELNAIEEELGETTIASIQANQQYDQILSKRTKALLSAEEENEEDDDPLEFIAKTAVFELTDDLRNQLLNDESEQDSTRALNPEEIKEIKLKVKAHYLKKARIVETEINKILSGLKTTNPKILKRLKLIKNLLSKHSGSYKSK